MASCPDRIEFVFAYPIYVLANNCTRHEDGNLSFSDETEFISPEMQSGVEHLAVFTDRDNAQRYLEQCEPGFQPFDFMPENLLRLVRWIAEVIPRCD